MILLFGDTYGIKMLLEVLPNDKVLGIVGASIRPQYLEELQEIADDLSIDLLIQPKPMDKDYPAFLEKIRELNPELIWVNSYSMILREDLFICARKGAINIHGALLPQYRGANPIQWAILSNETEIGVTLHEITASVDQGGIIDQRKVPLYFKDTWHDANNRIARATEDLLESNVKMILEGNWSSSSQDESMAVHRRRRKPEDGRFDWEEPVRVIYNLIRALVHPLPGAFYEVEKVKQTIETYKTPQQVVSSKYSNIGGQVLADFDIQLYPIKIEDILFAFDKVSKEDFISFFNYGIKNIELESWVHDLLNKQTTSIVFSVIKASVIVGLVKIKDFQTFKGVGEISYLELQKFNKEDLLSILQLSFDFSLKELGLRTIILSKGSDSKEAQRILNNLKSLK